MKKMLFVLFFTITSLPIYCQELVLQVPIAEANLCIALHNEIKASSPHAIQSYNHPWFGNLTSEPGVDNTGELFYSCLAVCHAHHNNALALVSEDQLHSMILAMTRSAESAYQEVAVEEDLSEDALGKCLGILRRRAILTTSDRPCPEGYAIVRYDVDRALVVEPMDISQE